MVPSGDGIDSSDRPLIDFSAGCAISNVSLRYQPAELGKCPVLVRERKPRASERCPWNILHRQGLPFLVSCGRANERPGDHQTPLSGRNPMRGA
jgi:hypothetical protein